MAVTAGTYEISITAKDSASSLVRKLNKAFKDQGLLLKDVSKSAKQLEADLRKAQEQYRFANITREMSKFGQSMTGAAKSAFTLMGGLGAIGSAVTAAGVSALISKFSTLNFNLATNAKLIGTSASELEKFQNAGALVGLDADSVTEGVKALGKAYQDSMMGKNDAAKNLFAGLEMDVRGPGGIFAKSGTNRDLFLKLAEKVSKMQDGPAKADLLRSAGVEGLLPLLNKGPEALKEIFAQIDKYSKYTEDAVKANEKIMKATGNLNGALGLLTDSIVIQLEPALDAAKSKTAEWATQLADWLPKMLDEQRKILKVDQQNPDYSPTTLGGNEGADLRKRLGLPDAKEGWWVNLKADIKFIKDELLKPLPIMNESDVLADKWEPVWKATKDKFWSIYTPMMDSFKTKFNDLVGEDARKSWSDKWMSIKDDFWKTWNPLFDNFGYKITHMFDGLMDNSVKAMKDAYEAVHGFVSDHIPGNGGSGGGEKEPSVPYTPGSITGIMGISQDQYNAFKGGVADIEHARYDEMGGAGRLYSGRYQMGRQEIADTAAQLGEQVPTQAQFLGDPGMQERYFEAYTKAHYDYLMKNSPEFRNATPAERLKILGYAHNQGPGGAQSWLQRGMMSPGHDAFHTNAMDYYNRVGQRLGQAPRKEPYGPIGAAGGSESAVNIKIDLGGFPVGTRTSVSTTGNTTVRTNRTAGPVLP